MVEYERRLEASTHRPERRTASRNRVAVLPKPFDDKRALELWTRFLYGQPIWDSSDDFDALVDVHYFAGIYNHYDAMDASIDAIRNIVSNHSDALEDPFTKVCGFYDCVSVPVRLLMDHVVYGKHVTEARNWVDAYLYGDNEPEDLQPLGNHLCNLFLAKAGNESAGWAPPDLDEGCRYHIHNEFGPRCYLIR